jgi:hypothetical protein
VVIEVVLTVVDFRLPGQSCLGAEEGEKGKGCDQTNPRGQASNELSPVWRDSAATCAPKSAAHGRKDSNKTDQD